MAYDATKPADDGYLAQFPPEMREQLRAIIQDAIVNAGTVQSLDVGNANGNIPVSNGTECANLNAAKVNDKTAADFAPVVHSHATVTSSSDGFMTAAQSNKLDGIAAGAEVNQSAFSNILVGSTTLQADSKTDTLEVVSGANITVTPDATNDRLTIAVSGKVPSAAAADSATTAGTCTGNSATATNATNLVGVVPTCGYCQPGASIGMAGQGGPMILAQSDGATMSAAMLTFHRPGIYAVNFGLDTDNKLKFGGWSAGTNVKYEIIHSGNIGSQSVNYATSANTSAACTGNSATATKLATARTITITGDASGSTSFDGSGNASISIDVGNANTVGGYTAAQLIANAGGIIASSLGTNGYVKFGNGLILQWGSTTHNQNDGVSFAVTFPISFSSPFSFVGTDNSLGIVFCTTLSATTANVQIFNRTSGYAVGSLLRWIAIGI